MSSETLASDVAEQPAGRSTGDRVLAIGAWTVWLAAFVTSLMGMAAGIASQSTPTPTLPQSAASIVAAAAIAVTYASVGLLLRLRRPRIVIGWLFLGIGLVSGFGAILWNYVWLSESLGEPPGPINGIQAAMLNEVLVVPGWAVLLVMLILLFPDGRLVDRAWRPVMGLAIAVSGVFALTLALNPGPLLFFPIYDNPIAPLGLGGDVMTALTSLTTIAIVALGAAAVWSVVVRYRRSYIPRAASAQVAGLGLIARGRRGDHPAHGCEPVIRSTDERGRHQLARLRRGLDGPAGGGAHRDPA